MTYDKRYSQHKSVFGEKPDKILIDHYRQINSHKPVLDIGAGQGRHSLFLAKEGYAVEALEPSIEGIKQIDEIAQKEKLPIFLSHSDIASFEPKCEYYSAILLFGILQILKREEIDYLLNGIDKWTASGSLVFVAAFSTDEPSFKPHKSNDKEIGKNSFEDTAGNIRTYLEPNEILTLFEGYEIIHHKEYLGKEHHHGDGKMQRHAIVESVFKKI